MLKQRIQWYGSKSKNTRQVVGVSPDLTPWSPTCTRPAGRAQKLTPGLPPSVCLRAYKQMRIHSSYLTQETLYFTHFSTFSSLNTSRGSEPPFHSRIVFLGRLHQHLFHYHVSPWISKVCRWPCLPTYLPSSFSTGRPALGPRPGQGLPAPASILLVGAHGLQIAPPGRLP